MRKDPGDRQEIGLRFKYYIRGIGVGILITTLIFIFAINSHGGILNDKSAVKRATELGYVYVSGDADDSMTVDEYERQNAGRVGVYNKNDTDTGTITNNTQSNSEDTGDDKDASASDEKDETKSRDEEDTSSETDTSSGNDSSSSTDSSSGTDRSSEEGTDDDSYHELTLKITGSDNSFDVAKKLQEAGIIKDASDFDEYMVSKGYDTSLREGISFSVNSNMSYDEIISEILK